MKKYSLSMFKPYQGKGAALFVEAHKKGFFFTMMPEMGERRFNSKEKVTLSIGQSDVAELLSVLRGHKDGIGQLKENRWTGLYHEVKGKHSSSLNFSKRDDNKGYSIALGRKVGDKVTRHSIGLTFGEAELLLEFLLRYLHVIFESEFTPNSNKKSAPMNSPNSPLPNEDIPF